MNSLEFIRLLHIDILEAINYFRTQDFYHGQNILSIILGYIPPLLSDDNTLTTDDMPPIVKESVFSITQILHTLLDAQQNDDPVLIADILEGQLLPFTDNILQQLAFQDGDIPTFNYLEANLALLKDTELANKIRKNALNIHSSTDFTVETTNTGFATLKYNSKNASFYYHSNVDPSAEARKFALYHSQSDVFRYTVFGLGLSYHVHELVHLDERFEVTAVETNLDVLTLAFIYRNMKGILSSPRFKLVFCDIANVSQLINDNTGKMIIHYPWLHALEEGPIKDVFSRQFMTSNSRLGQAKDLDTNFYYNIQHHDTSVDVLKNIFADKSVIYIGGGPSFEYYIDYVKQQQHTDTIITCASTVYKHLLENDIVPDYIFMVDCQKWMTEHVKDTPKTAASLIYLPTACYNAITAFPGERYLALQKNYPEAEEYAKEHNYTLFDVGASVSTLGVDLALKFHAKQLITIGLDLAYTDNKRHSFEEETLTENLKLIQVPSVTGQMIPTANNLNSYRLWIERRLENVTGISLINLSKGAYIKGMKNIDSPDKI